MPEGNVRMRNPRTAFTLVEALVALAIGAVVTVGLFSFLGDTIQNYGKESVENLSIAAAGTILRSLYRDLEGLEPLDEGVLASEARAARHIILYHRYDETVLHMEAIETEPPGNPLLRSSLAEHFLGDRTEGVTRARARLACRMLASWRDDEKYTVLMQVGRLEGHTVVRYEHFPATGKLLRNGEVLCESGVRTFRVEPVYDYLLMDGWGEGGESPRLLRAWVEMELEVDVPHEKGTRKPVKPFVLRTRFFPYHFNAELAETRP